MIEKPHDAAYTAKDAPPKADHALRARLSALDPPAWTRRAAAAALRFVYPTLCPICREETTAARGLCASCWSETTFVGGPACHTCGAPALGGAGPASSVICDACVHAPPAWSRGAAAVVYDGGGRRMILALKHGDRLDIAPLAARWMLHAGRDLVADADVIAPAPLHWRRLAKRRYNQAGELAREIAVAAGREDAARLDLLNRHRRTPSMDGLNRKGRHANVAGAFSLRRPEAVIGKRVLLIDDVLTTGATLSACAEICREGGAADVTALVFARVARDDWTP